MTTLSGHMIIKNGIKYDYPFIESCLSILPICDEFVFVEGNGDDGTYEALLELQQKHNKIKIYRHEWSKQHYSVMADLTNIAIEHCTSDYHIQIQADEGVSEQYHKPIRSLVDQNRFDFSVFGVLHFYGSFKKVYRKGVFYDGFIRFARRSLYPTLRSTGDAMSLGTPDSDSSKLKHCTRTDIKFHHYGYVRKPKCLIEKQDEAIKWWGIQERDPLFEKGLERGHIVWEDKHLPDRLNIFNGDHPVPFKRWMLDREEMVEKGIL